jgi:hypothetical protein
MAVVDGVVAAWEVVGLAGGVADEVEEKAVAVWMVVQAVGTAATAATAAMEGNMVSAYWTETLQTGLV